MRTVSLVLAFLLIILGSETVFGQSATEFESNYGSVKFYQVRYSTLLWPSFDRHGQMCRAVIVPNHDPQLVDRDPGRFTLEDVPPWRIPVYDDNDVDKMFPIFTLDVGQLKSILDELVPPATRKGEPRSDIDIFGFGSNYTVRFRFKNVMFSVGVALIRHPQTVNVDEIGGDINQFLHPSFGKITAAFISWPARKCVEQ